MMINHYIDYICNTIPIIYSNNGNFYWLNDCEFEKLLHKLYSYILIKLRRSFKALYKDIKVYY